MAISPAQLTLLMNRENALVVDVSAIADFEKDNETRAAIVKRYADKRRDYRAVYDDQKRMCMLVCWNTDMGDGWEEEGTDPWYFREFSEKYAYPMGINIIYYAMTH